MIHPKVKWAAIAAAVVTGLTAALSALGPTAPGWLVAAVTGIAAAVAGYSAPSDRTTPGHAEVQDVS